MITLAPERRGALEFIERVSGQGVITAIGHTGTDPGLIREAVSSGARISPCFITGREGTASGCFEPWCRAGKSSGRRAKEGRMLKRIKTDSLNTTAQKQIKLFIIESGLKAGDTLPTEKEMEEQLGISRTSIREALRSLEALGIMESRHAYAYLAAPVSGIFMIFFCITKLRKNLIRRQR